MKIKILFILFIFSIIIYPKEIIRINRNDYKKLPLKSVDIAGTNPKYGWMDIVVNNKQLEKIKLSGISYTIREMHNAKASVYMSADSIIDSMIAIANNYPTIVRLDTLNWSSNLQYPLVCMKISDNVNTDEYTEPAGLFVAMHHSREWQTPGTVLFFIDSLLKAYSDGDTLAIKYINNLEMYFMPLVNPEGYMYSRTTDNYWRKTRVYLSQFSSYGVDPNRNYGVSGPAEQSWGTTVNTATTHDYSSDVYCGPHPFTGTEIQAIKDIIESHSNMYLSITYHSYSELVLYPWGATTDTTLHNTQMKNFATQMASRLVCRDGTSTYTPEQSIALYATTGDMTDWAYAYCLYNLGRGHMSFTVEEDNTFQPDESDLDTLYRQQYQGFLYCMAYLDSMNTYPDTYIPKPISIIDSISASFNDSSNIQTKIQWNEIDKANSYNFKAKKYIDIHDTIDDLNTGDLWNLSGFILDNSHTPLSGSYTLWSDSSSYLYTEARTKIPYIVQNNDTIFTFYMKYDIENNYDCAYVEISNNGVFWELIDTNAVFMGTNTTWTKQSFVIPQKYRNKPLYFRFRYSTDTSVENMGFIVDSIFCVGTVIDTQIIDTLIDSLSYTDLSSDTNAYYSVTGKNIFGWGNESNIVKTEYSNVSLHEHNEKYDNTFYNEFIALKNFNMAKSLSFVYKLNYSRKVKIYNTNGQLVKFFIIPSGKGTVSIQFGLSSGIYYIKYDNKTIKFNYIH